LSCHRIIAAASQERSLLRSYRQHFIFSLAARDRSFHDNTLAEAQARISFSPPLRRSSAPLSWPQFSSQLQTAFSLAAIDRSLIAARDLIPFWPKRKPAFSCHRIIATARKRSQECSFLRSYRQHLIAARDRIFIAARDRLFIAATDRSFIAARDRIVMPPHHCRSFSRAQFASQL
jgi:hypothetical protein